MPARSAPHCAATQPVVLAVAGDDAELGRRPGRRSGVGARSRPARRAHGPGAASDQRTLALGVEGGELVAADGGDEEAVTATTRPRGSAPSSRREPSRPDDPRRRARTRRERARRRAARRAPGCGRPSSPADRVAHLVRRPPRPAASARRDQGAERRRRRSAAARAAPATRPARAARTPRATVPQVRSRGRVLAGRRDVEQLAAELVSVIAPPPGAARPARRGRGAAAS